MSRLTIVTYHYVRDLAASPFPRLAALDAAQFERQLDHIFGHYAVVGLPQVMAAISGVAALPEDACLLTFDDGYRDHATVAAPALARRGMTGTFYPAAAAVAERRLLDVNKIQFVLAVCADRAALRQELDRLIEEHRDETTPSLAELEANWHYPGRWDDADTVYVKRVLQQGLQPGLRDMLSKLLFRRHVSADEMAFADSLYLDTADMAAMMDAGMTFGSHGTRHQRLPLLDDETLEDDLTRALDFLLDAGVNCASGWSLCYPHGAQDARVRETARRLGCTMAVTTAPGVADLNTDDPLALPRRDTNELPQ